MGQLLMPTWAIRFDFAAKLVDDEARCRRIAEILMRPCFHELERLSIHRRDRWIEHGPKTAERIVSILLDRQNRGATFDTPKSRALVANGEIRNGTRDAPEGPTRFDSELMFPVERGSVEATVTAVCELADALDVGAGFIAVEPSYDDAHRMAIGLSLPRERAGVSTRRRIERRGRDWHEVDRARLLAGPEWGTFLGAQHLAKLDVEAVRSSGAFARVVELAPGRLVFLQVTNDPEDDLRDDFEVRLDAARTALAPIAMDLSDVNLD